MTTPETDIPLPADALASPAAREPAWDYLRMLATAAIVLIHVIAYALSANAGHLTGALKPRADELYAFSQALRWAVPGFALVTGALVWAQPWRGGFGAYRAFLSRRALVVAVPYLLWATIYYALRPSVAGAPWPTSGALPVLRGYLGALIDGSAWYHLYFVPMVLVLYVVTPLASRAARRAPELLVLALAALWIGWNLWLGESAYTRGAFVTLLNAVILYAPYAALGAWIVVRGDTVRRALTWVWPVLLVAGGYGLWARGWDRFLYTRGVGMEALGQLAGFAAVLGVLGLCLVVAGRWEPADRFAESFYATTFGIYLVHPLVLAGLGALVLASFPARELLSARDLVLMWAAVLLATWALVRALIASRWTRWIV
jgi:surface polysaccharide O-acyltransferase-like enzyme